MKEIDQLRDVLQAADAVLIGAGAGLSTSAGMTLSGERFVAHFGDFIAKYRFPNEYIGGFYAFPTREEYWAYWSRVIYYGRIQMPPKPVYEHLYQLVADKDYFVLTTNVDHFFQRTGFDKQRLFYTQGDYGLLQCPTPCHQQTYDSTQMAERMFREQHDMRVPTELLPSCPVCGKPMIPNLRCDERFVQDDGWYAAQERYEEWLENHRTGRIVYLDLGTGGNTPVIIKYPFWRFTYANPQATYVSINLGEACAPKEIADRSICINEDIGEALLKLKGESS
ncbi:MAG: hypothetical protein IJT35_04750 [Paludibacteraceae bacterium]|nr:hypothetical protein [Paludibacteraceae bacterium]